MHTHLQENFARIFATNPSTPPPITAEELEALRVRADIEYHQHRETSRVHRALVDQQQQLTDWKDEL